MIRLRVYARPPKPLGAYLLASGSQGIYPPYQSAADTWSAYPYLSSSLEARKREVFLQRLAKRTSDKLVACDMTHLCESLQAELEAPPSLKLKLVLPRYEVDEKVCQLPDETPSTEIKLPQTQVIREGVNVLTCYAQLAQKWFWYAWQQWLAERLIDSACLPLTPYRVSKLVASLYDHWCALPLFKRTQVHMVLWWQAWIAQSVFSTSGEPHEYHQPLAKQLYHALLKPHAVPVWYARVSEYYLAHRSDTSPMLVSKALLPPQETLTQQAFANLVHPTHSPTSCL